LNLGAYGHSGIGFKNLVYLNKSDGGNGSVASVSPDRMCVFNTSDFDQIFACAAERWLSEVFLPSVLEPVSGNGVPTTAIAASRFSYPVR
jgi:hypothetical protein